MKSWIARMAVAVSVVLSGYTQGFAYSASKSTGTAGEFDYYVMALSWSPSYCEMVKNTDNNPQCSVKQGKNPYTFILHGLWPQYEKKGWPQFCSGQTNVVQQSVIQKMMPIMPSAGLVIHEWKKHGTCSGLNQADYFNMSEKAFQKVTFPEKLQKPEKGLSISLEDLKSDFMKSNQGLTQDAFHIVCNKQGKLREIQVCLDKDATSFRTCGKLGRSGCGDTITVPY